MRSRTNSMMVQGCQRQNSFVKTRVRWWQWKRAKESLYLAKLHPQYGFVFPYVSCADYGYYMLLINNFYLYYFVCTVPATLRWFVPHRSPSRSQSQAGALGRRRIPSSMSAASPASMSANSPAEFEIGGASPCRPLRWSDDTSSLTANSRFWIVCVCFGILSVFAACTDRCNCEPPLNLLSKEQ